MHDVSDILGTAELRVDSCTHFCAHKRRVGVGKRNIYTTVNAFLSLARTTPRVPHTRQTPSHRRHFVPGPPSIIEVQIIDNYDTIEHIVAARAYVACDTLGKRKRAKRPRPNQLSVFSLKPSMGQHARASTSTAAPQMHPIKTRAIDFIL